MSIRSAPHSLSLSPSLSLSLSRSSSCLALSGFFSAVCQRAPTLSSISNNGNHDPRNVNKGRMSENSATLLPLDSRSRSSGAVPPPSLLFRLLTFLTSCSPLPAPLLLRLSSISHLKSSCLLAVLRCVCISSPEEWLSKCRLNLHCSVAVKNSILV
jgi:hypothetical protein